MSLQQASAPSGRLPSGYQEVEYIETTGTQYINTGIVNKLTSKFELTIQKTALEGDGNLQFENGTNWWCVGYAYDGNYWFAFGKAGNGMAYEQINQTASYSKVKLWVDTKNQQYGYDSTSINFTRYGIDDQNAFYIGAKNNNGSPMQYCKEKIFEFKYYENEILLNDFIPCYRTSDSEIGLYDVINNQFYTNNGSGNFTKGADV